MSWRQNRTLRQLIVGVVALVGGGVVTGVLVLTRTTPPPEEHREFLGPVVDVMVVHRQDLPVKIRGHGTVQPTVRTQVVPEVGGRVVSVHEGMFNGGFIPAGESLVVLDSSDYQLAVEEVRSLFEQERAAVGTIEIGISEARTNLKDSSRDLERIQQLYERGAVSRRDLDKAELVGQVAEIRVQREKAELETAQSRLEAVRVAVRKAELNLRRIWITLPFDSVVLSKRVDVGQYVVAGQGIGDVYGTSAMEIPVPLEDRQLQWLPTVPIGSQQSRVLSSSLPQAVVSARFAGQICRWAGRVVRVEGQVDPKSRMLDVVVRVKKPWQGLVVDQPPLLPGTFVEVAIDGKTLPDVIAVPTYAIHNEDELWVVQEGQLRVVKIRIAYHQGDWVYVAAGLKEGQKVIVSPMDVVTEGMRVRIAREQSFEGNNYGPAAVIRTKSDGE